MSTSVHPHAALRAALLLSLGLLLLLHPGRARAQSCSASNQTVAFGTVDVVSGSTGYMSSYNNGTTSTITVTCGVGLLALGSIKFSACVNIAGANGGNPRVMSSGANSLNYNLYTNSTDTTIWGTTGSTPGPVVVDLSITSVLLGASASSAVPIYGELLSSQNTAAVAGNYTQTPSATVTYNYTYLTLGTPAAPVACSSGPSGSNGSSSFTLMSTATVSNNCNISATTINFGGSVGVLSSAIPATGTITATCTNGDSYSIALNKGSTSGATLSNRLMAGSGSATVQYQLYTTSGYGTVWGDGTSGTSTVGSTGSGSAQNYTVYGQVPAQTTPAPNTYSDTVTVTVSY